VDAMDLPSSLPLWISYTSAGSTSAAAEDAGVDVASAAAVVAGRGERGDAARRRARTPGGRERARDASRVAAKHRARGDARVRIACVWGGRARDDAAGARHVLG
jgi:hypothetical protein